ncbi:MAG: carboxypeptidase-like regulatory domain-containing protein, partial [Bryobacteraceae bacterium]
MKRLYLLLLLAVVCLAQDFRGSLVGTVNDASGGLVRNAAITLRAAATSIERKAVSDSRGEFRFDDLSPGAYIVTANAQGFAEARAEVTVVISSTREITVTLNPASVQQSVNVPGQASSIATQQMDTTSAVHGGAVTAQDLAAIP